MASKTDRRAWSNRMDDLARQAVCTPSIDAPGAMEVYIDALLERGAISLTGDAVGGRDELTALAFRDAWRRLTQPKPRLSRATRFPTWVWRLTY